MNASNFVNKKLLSNKKNNALYMVVATLGSSKHMPIHKFDNLKKNKSMLHFPTWIECMYVP